MGKFIAFTNSVPTTALIDSTLHRTVRRFGRIYTHDRSIEPMIFRIGSAAFISYYFSAAVSLRLPIFSKNASSLLAQAGETVVGQ